jgi:pimeloyl-ACP methyl ester carboxylesterase
VVYLHGFASGPASQKAQYFRERCAGCGVELAIPDLAGGDFEHLTITRQLQVIEHRVDGRAVALIGSSMGGYLAALYAARHAGVERVVLMAPAFGFARRWPESLGEEKLREWKQTGFLEMYHYGEHRQRKIGYELLEDGARYEDFPDLRQPALIFHGRHDTVVPATYSEDFAATRANVRLEIIDSDHELLNALDHMWEHMRSFIMLS